MDPLSDDDLMRLFGEGDASAFDALFDRHYVAVYNFAVAMLGASEAEEALQETFLAIAQNVGKYAASGQFRSWLMRIVRNRCLNRLQARQARRALFGGGSIELVEPASVDPPPPRIAEANEQAQAIYEAVAQLPDRLREAICLFAFQQMSYREIASVLDMPLNTVKTLIHRARAELARRLLPGQEESPGEQP